jgi:uncharacterized membrane protein YdcZ (DUF606 family)
MPIASWSPTRLIVVLVLAGFVGGLTEPVLAALAPSLPRPTINMIAPWVRGTIAIALIWITVRWRRGWKLAANEQVAQALESRRKPW